ncbi:MAG: phosphate acyltransferase PlsX [Desulfobulbaceae bacterium]|nr:phosphate acyltransferase PlsX [Desulfobulbaceae bacterium]
MRIALDAMGGDHGPELLIRGALSAVREREDIEIVLLGPRELLEKHLAAIALDSDPMARISIEHAPETVSMHESPVDAMRKKKQSTIMVGFDMVRNKRADAVVSAGNSGATLAAAIKKLGRLKGVARPGIASLFPTLKKPVTIMDIGANVDCRAQHLFQFAIMASACSSILLGIENPRIGLLSIGEETGKGNALVKETYSMLSQSKLNFIGNVEGRDVYQGDVDVVICDGFVGNITLKVSEGLAEAVMKMLRIEIMKTWRAKIGYLLIRKALGNFRKRIDYAEYGGAPLLGINGTGIISHGKSNSTAIKNAILVAGEMVRHGINDTISTSLDKYSVK